MKTILLTVGIILSSHFCFAQSQIITTGNNLINPASPTAADVVIGSSANGGIRHDASIIWWSNASADRISDTGDEFYFSAWNTINANVGLSAVMGGASFFQGNLIIGQTTQNNSIYKLDVFGPARANSITVNATGADFVFEPDYKLYSLPELKTYIDQNHHLPGIPSAKEMQKDGLNVGENQIKLLQKVEELTLYLIDKDKQLNDEKSINDKQQAEIDSQKEQLQLAKTLVEMTNAQSKVQEEQITNLQAALAKLIGSQNRNQ